MRRQWRTLRSHARSWRGLVHIGLVLLALGFSARTDAEAAEASSARQLLEDFKTTVDFSHVSDHRWVELKYAEVGRVYALLDRHPVDATAVRAGRWSDSSTWSTGAPPGPDTTVWIPAGLRVEVDIRDMSGNARSTTIRLRVDSDAPCRGPNIDHYVQVSR